MAAGCASLLLEVAEQRRVADALHALACQELAFTRERQQHEHEYRSQEDGQVRLQQQQQLHARACCCAPRPAVLPRC